MSRREEQEKEMADRGWVTPAKAADILKVDLATVYRKAQAGDIETTKVVSRMYLSEDDVRRLAGPLADEAPR